MSTHITGLTATEPLGMNSVPSRVSSCITCAPPNNCQPAPEGSSKRPPGAST